MRRLFLTTSLMPLMAFAAGGARIAHSIPMDLTPIARGPVQHSTKRSKTTCAQMKRKAAKRKAKRRARRLGHA